MTNLPKHSVSVAGVVLNDSGQVLVIQRRDNLHWEPPGGILELGETPQEGTFREILEETGIRVEVGDLTGIYKNMERGVVSLVFRCRAVAGKEMTSSETRRVAWRSIDSATRDMSPAYAVRITDAFTEDVRVRSHNGHELLEEEKL